MLGSLFTNFFVLLALYCGVISVLLPNHVAALDPANSLAIVMTTALLFTISLLSVETMLGEVGKRGIVKS